MICPRCQNIINDEMVYCPRCGLKIEKCPTCGRILMPNAKFCSYCGKPLYQETQEEQIREDDESILQQYTDSQTYENIEQGSYENVEQDSYENVEQNNIYQDQNIENQSQHKKVNKKKIMIITAIVFILTIISFIYLYFGPELSVETPSNEEMLSSEKLTVGSTTSFASHTGNINQEGFVYQTKEQLYICDESGYLVVMDTKLENRKTLINEAVGNINVIDDTIYYTDKNDHLCSISTSGKDQKIILNQKVFYVIVKEDKIYYQLDDAGKEHIYVYDLKTNKQTELNQRHSYHLNVLDDKIYFTSTDGIYVMGIDGQGEEKLISDIATNLIYQDGKLYYQTKDYQIMSLNIQNNEKEVLIRDRSQLLNLTNDHLFYYTNSGEVMRYDLKDKKTKAIYRGQISGGYILGDKLILKTISRLQNSSYQIIMDFDGEVQQRLFDGESSQNQGDFI